jgi:hypothetical protein
LLAIHIATPTGRGCPYTRWALATNLAVTYQGGINGDKRWRGKGAMRKTRILGSGMYLPGRLITNADLEAVKELDTSDEWGLFSL